MTKEWYKNMGFAVSTNLDQAPIDKAECEVFNAYIAPILPTAHIYDEAIGHDLAELAFLYLLQHTDRVTRGGTKQKTDANSVNVDAWSAMSEQVSSAAHAVKHLRAMDGAVADAEVDDICKIYFKSNFFYN